ncbi:tyrosine-type recombinase/integrase [Brevibacillus laterosporus]|uniref:tyrosine-type recombinase/integrase n=1 Tax=Brevibacillus laterosporus TaxID=1465 RepID=UPI00112B1CAF|nr:tyrosine-type recombinase/integrase [Brevibacillus laterosporus]MBG9790543.1 hypothetical protein [Brevibacillus laterosporus]MBG9804929.1 hypothetical protein [Brevibacillus laterosporus]MED1786619.1 tyrosine-type recombinase/integrase [Brevibacillus laterosporus]MED4766127.1 tyrosine-type recombinase/integrase [Brevibacillus laterosporus]TPH15916.1 hypothetical protein EGH09_11210 [Brevibacillus laterosporus]
MDKIPSIKASLINLNFREEDEIRNVIESGAWSEDKRLSSLLLDEGKVLTLEQLEDEYIFFSFYLFDKPRNKKLTEGTISEYKRDFKSFIDFISDPAGSLVTIGNMDVAPSSCRLKQIGRYHLRAYERYINSKYARNTALKKLTFVKSLLKYGYDKGYFTHNLRDEFAIGRKINTITERKLNYEELQVVLNELRKKPLHRIIGSFLILKGLRVSEICKMNFGDLETGLYGDILIKIERKGGKIVRKKIPKGIMFDIIQYRQMLQVSLNQKGGKFNDSPDSPLIPNSLGQRLLRDRIWDIVKRAAKRASKNCLTLKTKAQYISPHWFRHTFATIALDSGASLQDVKDELGHEDIRTTQIYLHSLKEETGTTLADLISNKVII